MGEEKRSRKITDVAAGVIDWHDRMQVRFDRGLSRLFRKITDGAAAAVTFHDNAQAKGDRILLIAQYHPAKFIHEKRKFFVAEKKSILGHFAGAVLITIAVVALYSHASGYQYSYNGRVLGYVKNQEDVVKILDLVSSELSEEYGSTVQIDKENDIQFKTVFILDKEVDDVDTVLKRFTYTSDMEAEGYGIYIEDNLFVICESKAAAEDVLENVQQEYLKEEGDDLQYEEVGFKEDVRIKKVNTKLNRISNVKKAADAVLNGGSKEIIYEVKAGDTYSEILDKYDLTFEELKKINPDIEMDSLYPGDELTIQRSTSALTVVTVEKATYAEIVEYKTEYKKSNSMYEGDSKVTQKGSDGKRVVTARITRENGEVVGRDVLETETIKKAVKRIVVKGIKKVPKTAPTGKFIMPVSGYSLTSTFGWRWGRMHEGLDLACGTGTTIRASDGGTVTYAGWYSGYGLFIEIDHGNGIHTRYGHCNSIDVRVGEKVYQGQKIGEVGNTGNSYGSHCHFEITVNGSPVDPFKYL